MAIKAGLVGVNPKGVDKNGMPKGGEADKQLTANGKKFFFAYDETSEKYGYKLDGTGNFIPFESAGGGPGWVKPADLTTEGLTYQNLELVSGGYYIDSGICYIDMCLKSKSSSGSKYLKGLAAKVASGSTFIQIYGAETADVADQYIFNSQTQIKNISDSENMITNADQYMHLFGMCTAV